MVLLEMYLFLFGSNNKTRNGWNLKGNLPKLELKLETSKLDFNQNNVKLIQID